MGRRDDAPVLKHLVAEDARCGLNATAQLITEGLHLAVGEMDDFQRDAQGAAVGLVQPRLLFQLLRAPEPVVDVQCHDIAAEGLEAGEEA